MKYRSPYLHPPEFISFCTRLVGGQWHGLVYVARQMDGHVSARPERMKTDLRQTSLGTSLFSSLCPFFNFYEEQAAGSLRIMKMLARLMKIAVALAEKVAKLTFIVELCCTTKSHTFRNFPTQELNLCSSRMQRRTLRHYSVE